MKEAKGKPEQNGQAGRRIPIEVFSTQRWTVRMKLPSRPEHDYAGADRDFAKRVLPLCSRELNLRALVNAAHQKWAA